VSVGFRQGCPLSLILFVIFMDKISRRSRCEESAWFGDLKIASLLFADDVVLLARSDRDLKHSLGRFAAECEVVRMRSGWAQRDRVSSSDIRRELGVEPLLLRVKTSQLRWFGHLIRMPTGRLPLEVFWARPTGRRPRGRPGTRWRDYISHLAWK